MGVNYGIVLENTIKELNGRKPKLMLHSCCAPCSSYVLDYLWERFDITVYYYNPNIFPSEEYQKRAAEQEYLIKEMFPKGGVKLICEEHLSEEFYSAVKGMENIPEGGERCFVCYRLRLKKTAKAAKKYGCEYFCTTLSISPLKNAAKLNEIGGEIAEKYGVKYLFSDFKKKDGYKKSCALSQKFGLYRQNYCGCEFSQNQTK